MHRHFTRAATLLIATALAATAATAAVQPSSLFTDGAVLQQGVEIPVWGRADSGERITVSLNGQTATTVSLYGRWMVRLRPEKAGGPYTMAIAGDMSGKQTIRNVLVGEVWVCSGQSNMQWPLRETDGAEEMIARSADPMLRLITVPRKPAGAPASDVDAAWQECNPQTVPEFSAVGYIFGRDLRKALGVPVGLINTSWGGTPAQSWASEKALMANADLRYYVTDFQAQVARYPDAMRAYRKAYDEFASAKAEGRQGVSEPKPPANPLASPYRPASLFNGMIAPLVPYGIKGAIWYQGESNAGKAYEYRKLFPTMIESWREAWGLGDFPFLFAQLAPYMKIVTEPQESAWAELREAQLLTDLNLKNTGMAVITDVGDPKDIHPRKKEPVGGRLALAARAIAYGEGIPYSGPVYRSLRVRGNRAIVSFDHVNGGLEARGGSLTGFSIAGADRKFVTANAEIDGESVVVYSPAVGKPVAVRFGWADCPVVNLYNKAGLPASPFRTDDFPMVTNPAK